MRNHAAIHPFVISVIAGICVAAGVVVGVSTASAQNSAQCLDEWDCPGAGVCRDGQCVSPSSSDEYQRRSERPTSERRPSATSPPPGNAHLLDDGGADAVCGADRRCRIERIAARNRLRRKYEAAEHQLMVDQEVERMLNTQTSNLPRVDRPYTLAFHIAPLGHGIIGGYTFRGHLRAESTLLTQDDRIRHTPDDQTLAPISERQHIRSLGAHLTYLSSTSTFSPLLSIGFIMARGSLGSQWSSDAQVEVRYHLVTAAIGAELQHESGFFTQLAFRHGRLLYNQVRYGPGNYDAQRQSTLRDFMHSDGIYGAVFSLGWAFQ